MSSEVGSGQVAIFPVFKGFRRLVSKEVDGATQDGTRRATRGFRDAGTQSGRGFKDTFTKSSQGTSQSIIKGLNADIASTSKALSSARLKELDAAGKVRVAEVQLTEARKKYGAESSQVVRVQERLATATRGLSSAQESTRGISDRLKTSQTQLASATRAAETQTVQAASGFRRFYSAVGTGAASTASGLQGAFGRAFTGLQGIASRSFDAVLGVARTAGFAIGGILSLSLVGGFKRLSAIENAQAKLKGLGNSAEDVTQIMEDALGAVRGTAFGLDEAAGVAATAVAAGIKPGKELNKYLSLTADTATIAGTSISEMGSILNKTTTSGKVYTESLNQLADRGIPVFQYLQKEYGVTAEKLTEMVSSGKVDAATLRKVLEENLGGAAQASGDTTTGAFKNMLAALNRVGAGLLGQVFPYFKDFFGSVTVLFDALGPTSKRVGEAAGNALRPSLEAFTRITDKIGELASSDEGITFSGLRASFPTLNQIANVLDRAAPSVDLMKGAFSKLGPVLAPLLPQLAESGEKLLPALVDAVVELTPSLVKLIPKLVDLAVVALPLLADILTNGVVPVLGFVAPLISSVFDSAKILGDYLGGDISAQGWVDAMNGIYETLGPLGGYGQAVLSTLEQIVNGANLFGQAIGLTVQTTINWFLFFRDYMVLVFGVVNNLFFGLPMAAGQAVASVIGAFQQLQTYTGIAVGIVIQHFGRMLPEMASAAGRAVGTVIGILAGLPPRSVAALGDLGSLLFRPGQNLILGFARGITSSIGSVTSAVSRVLSVVPDFFPNSPAKRGPLSGAGWRKIGRSGQVIADQFTSGLPTGSALDPAMSRMLATTSTAASNAMSRSRIEAGPQVNFNAPVYAQDVPELIREQKRGMTRARSASLGGARRVRVT